MNSKVINVLPDFENFNVEILEKEISQCIKNNILELKNIKLKIEKNLESFDASIRPLENLNLKLENLWSPFRHLHGVADNEKLRAAYERLEQEIVDYYTKLEQDATLFELYKKLKDSKSELYINAAQERYLDLKIQAVKLSGVDLPSDKKNQYKKFDEKLAKLSTEFNNNILDSTDNWSFFVAEDDKEQIKGIPTHTKMHAKECAEAEGKSGYLFGLDAPTYMSIMLYADNTKLRKRFHKAYATRASDVKNIHDLKYDNSQNLIEILKNRHEQANLLGFNNFAEYSIAPKMAKSVQEVKDFLWNLVDKAKEHAIKDYQDLQFYAKNKHNIDKLEAWDIAYYSEKQKKDLFDISQEELRKYFPLSKVLNGLFTILKKLYGISFKENNDVKTWHKDAFYVDVYNKYNEFIGGIYFDLFARKHKRGGAWMDECRVRMKTFDNSIQAPIAYVTCNFNSPEGNDPALLTHDDVLTLFHEVGHALHHVLTKIDYRDISGINGVPWDVVELPSQIHENWCWEEQGLELISEHIVSKESLPKEILLQLKKLKNHQSGLFLVRQLEFALFDITLHENFDPNKGFEQVAEILKDIRNKVSVIPKEDYDRFAHAFSHVFGGGYAAGYYSYLWADMLAADAYNKFKEEGIFSQKVGPSFLHNILEVGGSVEPLKMFENFRGRKPDIKYLLKDYGLE